MPDKKKPTEKKPRNPVARAAAQFNKAAVHVDKKKEQKKTGKADKNPSKD